MDGSINAGYFLVFSLMQHFTQRSSQKIAKSEHQEEKRTNKIEKKVIMNEKVKCNWITASIRSHDKFR